MKPHLIFKEKLDHYNIKGIVYIIDEAKSNPKEYYWVGKVRVIFSFDNMIAGHFDLCNFKWEFGSSLVHVGDESILYCRMENKIISKSIRNHIKNMKLYFPQYKAGLPEIFQCNQTKEFMELTKGEVK